MLLLLVLFNIELRSSEAHTLQDPAQVLSTKVYETTLKPRAKRALERNFGVHLWPTVTIADLTRLLSAQLQLGSIPVMQTMDFLEDFNLRLNLLNEEVEFYRLNGRLPPVDGTSPISVLGLTLFPTKVLLDQRILRLDDIRKTSLRELMGEVKMGPVRVLEIKRAFERVGMKVYANRPERICEEALRGTL